MLRTPVFYKFLTKDYKEVQKSWTGDYRGWKTCSYKEKDYRFSLGEHSQSKMSLDSITSITDYNCWSLELVGGPRRWFRNVTTPYYYICDVEPTEVRTTHIQQSLYDEFGVDKVTTDKLTITRIRPIWSDKDLCVSLVSENLGALQFVEASIKTPDFYQKIVEKSELVRKYRQNPALYRSHPHKQLLEECLNVNV